jgi:hypothetical protein
MKPATVKTILLGMAVILITALIFIALPVIVPSFNNISCEKLIWGCSQRCMPLLYVTQIWDEDTYPPIERSWGFGSIHVENHTDNKNVVTASGYLLYGNEPPKDAFPPVPLWRGGLTGRTIMVTIFHFYENETVTEDLDVKTGDGGYFSFDVPLDENELCYRIEGAFHDEIITPVNRNEPIEVYFSSVGGYTDCPSEFLKKRETSYWWVWLVSGLVMIIIGISTWWYIQRSKRKVKGEKEQVNTIIDSEGVKRVEKKQPEIGGNTTRVSVTFSDIEESFPDVWGVKESIAVSIMFRDRNQNRLLSQAGVVIWGDGDGSEVDTGSEGSPQLSHEYDEKGEYRITASYKEAGMGKVISSWRTIHIVDYREEMVRLFGEMLEELNLTDREITRDMTPREVEEILAGKLEEVSRESLRNVIIGFEEANYSTHPVNRESYVRMYRATGEVRGKG